MSHYQEQVLVMISQLKKKNPSSLKERQCPVSNTWALRKALGIGTEGCAFLGGEYVSPNPTSSPKTLPEACVHFLFKE